MSEYHHHCSLCWWTIARGSLLHGKSKPTILPHPSSLIVGYQLNLGASRIGLWGNKLVNSDVFMRIVVRVEYTVELWHECK